MMKVIGYLLSGLTMFVMVMGFYFIYGVIYLAIARGIVNELIFAIVNLSLAMVSAVGLLLAEVKWGA